MWNPDKFMESLYERSAAARKKQSELGREERKALQKEHLRAALVPFEEMPAPLDPILLERTEYDDYVRERVEIGTVTGLRMPVYVLIPKESSRTWELPGNSSGKLPGMLALHGHGYGSREVAGFAPDGTMSVKKGGHNRFALELTRQGHIVAAPEMIGFGDRRLLRDTVPGKERSSCNSLTGQLLMHGMSLAGLRVYEAIRTLDYLSMRARPILGQSAAWVSRVEVCSRLTRPQSTSGSTPLSFVDSPAPIKEAFCRLTIALTITFLACLIMPSCPIGSGSLRRVRCSSNQARTTRSSLPAPFAKPSGFCGTSTGTKGRSIDCNPIFSPAPTRLADGTSILGFDRLGNR